MVWRCRKMYIFTPEHQRVKKWNHRCLYHHYLPHCSSDWWGMDHNTWSRSVSTATRFVCGDIKIYELMQNVIKDNGYSEMVTDSFFSLFWFVSKIVLATCHQVLVAYHGRWLGDLPAPSIFTHTTLDQDWGSPAGHDLTHCGLVVLYGDIDLGQHWLR